jgi:hypothetical protein
MKTDKSLKINFTLEKECNPFAHCNSNQTQSITENIYIFNNEQAAVHAIEAIEAIPICVNAFINEIKKTQKAKFTSRVSLNICSEVFHTDSCSTVYGNRLRIGLYYLWNKPDVLYINNGQETGKQLEYRPDDQFFTQYSNASRMIETIVSYVKHWTGENI